MSPGSSRLQTQLTSGSPTPGEPEFLVIGKLGRPHGVDGEIAMEVFTDFPERITPGETFYIESGHQTLKLLSCRPHKHGLLVKFEGFNKREQASKLTNQLIHVRREDRPLLEEGEYYHHQLLGLSVIDEENKLLGIIADILSTGANDVYIVHSDNGSEILLPAIDAVVLNIDLDTRKVYVRLIPGLLEE
jgi:16S rRNA processing protein RimM